MMDMKQFTEVGKGYTMNKEEALRVLVLLSQMEGFTIGKFGDHCLPDWISEELANVCELLEKNIRGDTK